MMKIPCQCGRYFQSIKLSKFFNNPVLFRRFPARPPCSGFHYQLDICVLRSEKQKSPELFRHPSFLGCRWSTFRLRQWVQGIALECDVCILMPDNRGAGARSFVHADAVRAARVPSEWGGDALS
jgi:hypothetical protein